MATIGKLNILITAGTQGLKTGLSTARSMVGGFARSLGGLMSTLGGFATSLTGVGTGLGALVGIGFGLKMAGELEQATMAFEVMFGSAEKAKSLVADMREFAAQTPFETSDLIQAGRTLASFGVSVENIMPAMKMLGDVSSGVGAPLNEIAELFGKVHSTGRVSAITLKQFALRGVPLMKELAKQFKVSESEVTNLVEEGKVGFPQLLKAFESATGSGGIFENMMARQSTTFLGLLSTLKDNAMIAFTDFSQILIDAFDLKGLIGSMNTSTGGLAGWVSSLKPVFERAAGFLKAVFSAVWEQLKSLAAPFIAIKDVVLGLFKAMGIGADDVAGALTRAVTTMINWLPSAEKMRAGTITALEGIGVALVYLGGWAKQFAGWVTKYIGEPLLTWTAKGIRALEALYGAMTNLPGIAGVAAEGAKLGAGMAAGFVEGMAAQAGPAGDKLIGEGSLENIKKAAEEVRKFFGGIRAGDFVGDIVRWIDSLGEVGDKTKEIGKFNLGNVIPADLIDKAKKLKEGLLSPADKFRQDTRDLNMMLRNGLITQQQFAIGAARIAADLDKAVSGGPSKGPEALLKGSKEAASAVLRFQREGQDRGDPLTRIGRNLEEAKRIQERTAKAAEETARALKVLGNPVIVGI